MSLSEIFKQILPLSLLIALPIAAIDYMQVFDYMGFVWASWLFFIFNTALVLYLASTAKNSRTAGTSAYVMLAAMFVKFFTAIFFILGYYILLRPEGKEFVVPFFILYAIYTIYETRALLQINRRIGQ